MNDLFEISKKLSTSALTEIINLNQSNKEIDIFQKINVQKILALNLKRKIFENGIKKIFIIFNENNFNEAELIDNSVTFEKINVITFLNKPNLDIKNKFTNSLVILTNNIFFDVGIKKFFDLQKICDSTLWLIQDYDNHHWIENSIQGAIFADIYIPSHMDGEINLLSRINSTIIDYIPIGTTQWSEKFINENIKNLKLKGRNHNPFGKYYYYEKFKNRNRNIEFLNTKFPDINYASQDFHKLSQQSKWNEWVNYSIHWIVPTANDLPIRFFDSLISGGLPLVPVALTPYLNYLNINNKYYQVYNQLDIQKPNNIIQNATLKIINGGDDALKDRCKYAFNNFHVNKVIRKIITLANKLINLS